MKLKGRKTYLEMIIEAVKSLNDYNGTSRQAVIKYITSNYDIEDKNVVKIRTAISKALEDGNLKFGKTKYVIKIGDKMKKDTKRNGNALKSKPNKILLPSNEVKKTTKRKDAKLTATEKQVAKQSVTSAPLITKPKKVVVITTPKIVSTKKPHYRISGRIKPKYSSTPLVPRLNGQQNTPARRSPRVSFKRVSFDSSLFETPINRTRTQKRLATPGRGNLKRMQNEHSTLKIR